jgi:hypothetical protein
MSDETHFKLTVCISKQKKLRSTPTNEPYTANMAQCHPAFLVLKSLCHVLSVASGTTCKPMFTNIYVLQIFSKNRCFIDQIRD